MEDLSKTQLVLLILLGAVVASITTVVTTIVVIEDAPRPLATTIQRVIERTTVNEAAAVLPPTQERVIVTGDRIPEVVASASPAVVSIVASKDVPLLTRCYTTPFGGDEFFDSFFPEFRIPSTCQNGTERREVGAGTGFFVDSDGRIATNRHVVEDTEASYTVILNNGKQYPATVLARDPFQDLAIIKIEGEGYPTLELGNSETISIGSSVIAIGNALGEFQNTVSAGVISGLSRNITAGGGGRVEELRSLIQTDAAINPGNSGGPLLTLDGKVIGINTAVAQGAQGIGFALPVNLLKKDLQSIETFGQISYPYIGIRYISVTEEIALQRELGVSYGALIEGNEGGSGVLPESPADTVGLVSGDIILEVDGRQINPQNPLADTIQRYNAGDSVVLRVKREGGAEEDITLVLGELTKPL